MNTELIKALRWCGSEDERHEMCVDESYRCPMWNEDMITDECKAELMRDAAYALEADEKRIAKLMPKEGEWIETEMGFNSYAWVCSACGEPWVLNAGTPSENNMNYCPNCGAKMKIGEDK